MLALIVFSWMPYARIVNALAAQLRSAEFVVAARALGASDRRIIVHHLFPNVIAPAIVLAARDIGSMVILESAFTFIGLRGTVAWGVLLVAARDYVIGIGGNPFAYWWTFLPVALALILFGVGWNLLGDGLNTMLNPYAGR
jgi:peptide/nickel transport system permease protein